MKKILAFFLLLPALSTFARDQVYVAYFSTVGTDRHTGVSAAHIFSDYVNEYGVYSAIMPQQRDTNYHVEAISEARESAELLSTTYFVMGQIVRMENVYHVSVSMYAVSSGVIVWNRHESTTSAQDIAVILDKIAFELGTEKKMSQKGDVYRVTRSEAEPMKKFKSSRSIGLSTGAILPLSADPKKHSFDSKLAPGLGLVFSNDLRNFIFQIHYNRYEAEQSFSNAFGEKSEVYSRYQYLTIETLYPLSTTNNAPFVSIGAGYAGIKRKYTYPGLSSANPNYIFYKESETFRTKYMMFNGGVGYILRRNANTSLYVYGRGYLLITPSMNVEYGAMLNFALLLGRR